MTIFVSYRRRDSNPDAHCIADRLRSQFGQNNVFIDDSTIQVGDIWPQQIESALESAKVLLVIIGAQWLSTTAQH